MNLRVVWPRPLWFRFVAWFDGIVVVALVVAALALHMINEQALEAAIRAQSRYNGAGESFASNSDGALRSPQLAGI